MRQRKINMYRFKYLLLFILLSLLMIIECDDQGKNIANLENSIDMNRQPVIYPDYIDTILPPNIAPTNFNIKEEGRAFYVRISSESGKDIRLFSRSAKIKIPNKLWKNLLDNNREKDVFFSIYVKNKNNNWSRFLPIKNLIANDNIDSHLVYRIIPPLYQYYDKMRIYQRDLTNFDERTIAYNKSMGYNCVNCHSFHNYNPDRMIFHMRAGEVGTSMIVLYDDEIFKVDTKTSFNNATSYRSWHPNGEVIAFAFNNVKQLFHAIGENRDVYDIVSDLLLYHIKSNTITTSAKISSFERMETYPEWSPDGKYLYFCSAPGLDYYDKKEHPYKKIKYDLQRIAYDSKKDSLGDVETVLNASDRGKSVAHAKISPDGRYILLCLSDYSYFPLYKPESDLYLYDLSTNILRKPEIINSDLAESYHCWASNGRWIVFSSKRRDGICTDAYFAYFDVNGEFSKPFILPQKDPERHRKLFRVYNVPEFIAGPVTVSPQKILKTVWSKKIIKAKLDPKITRKSENQTEETMYQSSP